MSHPSPKPGEASAAGRRGVGDLRGGLEPTGGREIPLLTELRLLRALDELGTQLRDAGDVERAARLAARFAAALLRADRRCLALLEPGRDDAVIAHTGAGEPTENHWDRAMLARFARGQLADVPDSAAMARLKRRSRPWATLALAWNRATPDWQTRNALTHIAAVCNEAIERIESRRLIEVRARIDRKIMEQLRPKDLFYQILDGLRSLTGYDHSGAIFLAREDGGFELAAEQLAWRKGKSKRVGSRLPPEPWLRSGMDKGCVWGYSLGDTGYQAWDAAAPARLASWLGAGQAGEEPAAPPAPPEAEFICAPLHSGDQLVALLKVSALHHRTFGPYETDLVAAMLPQAMIAMQNARRTESLEEKMIQAERKHAMAELARGVAHDVNNALGAALPLVQQLRDDVATNRLDPAALAQDLEHIESSIRACTRIFGGMLLFARRSAQDPAVDTAHIEPALEAALSILGDGLRRQHVEIVREIASDLPTLPVRQTELEQVFLNLIANARDALAAGGRAGTLHIRACTDAQASGSLIRIEVADTGIGIPAENRARVLEPFFTTKPAGNGLGLSICRSIVWQCQGRIHLECPSGLSAEPGRPGTRVIITAPAGKPV